MPTSLPKHYQDARAGFLDLAKRDYETSSYTLPGYLGPHGEILTCDVASHHVPGAETAIITTSGIHGVEGYAGSALQQHFMKLGNGPSSKVSLIHVHAINPYGFAHDRRADAENFDVNRNFLETYPSGSIRDEYYDYADIIVPKAHSNRLLTELKFIYYALTQQSRMKDIITRGQSSCADGMYYTGLKPSWSRWVWEQVVASQLSRYRKVMHLDIHTGLGASAELQIMGASTRGPEVDLARALWGARIAFMQDEEGRNTTLSSPTIGEILSSWRLLAGPRPAEAVTYLMEFGTLPPIDVFKALRGDHMAHARGERDAAVLAPVNAAMRAAFAPSGSDWIAKVLRDGGEAYSALLQALESRAI